MVLYLIDQHCRMLQTDTDCNAFRFNRHMIRSQPTIYISRRMSGCQYHGSEKSLSCICFDTFDFIVLNNQCIHSCLEMYFSATFDNGVPHIFNDTWQFVCSDMRMRIHQYRSRSSMLAKYVQNLIYIPSLLAPGIEFPIRISSCTPFAKTVIRFRVNRVFPADLC